MVVLCDLAGGRAGCIVWQLQDRRTFDKVPSTAVKVSWGGWESFSSTGDSLAFIILQFLTSWLTRGSIPGLSWPSWSLYPLSPQPSRPFHKEWLMPQQSHSGPWWPRSATEIRFRFRSDRVCLSCTEQRTSVVCDRWVCYRRVKRNGARTIFWTPVLLTTVTVDSCRGNPWSSMRGSTGKNRDHGPHGTPWSTGPLLEEVFPTLGKCQFQHGKSLVDKKNVPKRSHLSCWWPGCTKITKTLRMN